MLRKPFVAAFNSKKSKYLDCKCKYVCSCIQRSNIYAGDQLRFQQGTRITSNQEQEIFPFSGFPDQKSKHRYDHHQNHRNQHQSSFALCADGAVVADKPIIPHDLLFSWDSTAFADDDDAGGDDSDVLIDDIDYIDILMRAMIALKTKMMQLAMIKTYYGCFSKDDKRLLCKKLFPMVTIIKD